MRRAAIEASTRRWIERFVVREKLCPFAAKSAMRLHVETFGVEEADLLARHRSGWRLTESGNETHVFEGVQRMGRRLEQFLAEDVRADATSNLFLVWPIGLADHADYISFSQMLLSWFRLGDGTGGPEESDAAAVGFPFHPRSGEPGGSGRGFGCEAPQPSYVFRSPYPMLHLIPMAELSRARTGLRQRSADGRGLLVQQRNAQLMRAATDGDRERWDSLLAECRDR